MQAEHLNQLEKDLRSQDEARILSALHTLGELTYGRASLLALVERLAVQAPSDLVRQTARQTLSRPIFQHLQNKRRTKYPASVRTWLQQEIHQWQQEGLIGNALAEILQQRYALDEPRPQHRPRPQTVSSSPPATSERPAWQALVFSERGLMLALYLGAFFLAVSLGVLAVLKVSFRAPISLGATLLAAALTPLLSRRSARLGAVFLWLSGALLAVDVRVLWGETAHWIWAALWGGLILLWAWGGRRFHARLLTLSAVAALWLAAGRAGALSASDAYLWRVAGLGILHWAIAVWYADAACRPLQKWLQRAALGWGAVLWVYFFWYTTESLTAAAAFLALAALLYGLFHTTDDWLRPAGLALAGAAWISGALTWFYGWQNVPWQRYTGILLWGMTTFLWAGRTRNQTWRYLLWGSAGAGLFLAWQAGIREEQVLWAAGLAAVAAAGQAWLARQRPRLSAQLAAAFSAWLGWVGLALHWSPMLSLAWVAASGIFWLPRLLRGKRPGPEPRLMQALEWSGAASLWLGLLLLAQTPAGWGQTLSWSMSAMWLLLYAWRVDARALLGLLALAQGWTLWPQERPGWLAWQVAVAVSLAWLLAAAQDRPRRRTGVMYALMSLGVVGAFFLPAASARGFLAFYALAAGLGYMRWGQAVDRWAWNILWQLTFYTALQPSIWRWGLAPWVWLASSQLLPSPAQEEEPPSLANALGLWCVSLLAGGMLDISGADGQQVLNWTLLWLANIAAMWRYYPRPLALWPVTLIGILWLETASNWAGWEAQVWLLTLWMAGYYAWAQWKGPSGGSWASTLRAAAAALGAAAVAYGYEQGGLQPVLPLASGAVLVTLEAIRQRNIWLGYPAALLYLLAYFQILSWAGAQNVQLYTAGAAAAGLVMHYLLRQYHFERAAWLTGALAQLTLLGVAWQQMLQHEQLWYFIVLLLEALLTLGYGVLMRSRSLTSLATLFLLLGGLTILRGWLQGLGVVVVLGAVGLALLALGVYGVQQRERWQRLLSQWEEWKA